MAGAAARLPADPDAVVVVDLDAARAALGLSDGAALVGEDLDTADQEGWAAPRARLWTRAGGAALQHLTGSLGRPVRTGSIPDALDTGRASAVATGWYVRPGGDIESVTVLRTEQSILGLAEQLDGYELETEASMVEADTDGGLAATFEGYDLDAGVLVAEEVPRTWRDVGLIARRAGFLVLAQTLDDIAEVRAADEASPGDLLELLGTVDAPARYGSDPTAFERSWLGGDEGGHVTCVTAVVVGDHLAEETADLVLRIDGDVDRDRVGRPPTWLSFGEPAVDGNLVRIRVGLDEARPSPAADFRAWWIGGPMWAGLPDYSADAVYECS